MTAALISPGRIIVRVLQVVCPIIAMIFLSLGSIEFSSGQLSSGSAIFSNIACYSAAVCGFYYAVALGVLKLTSSAPKVLYQRLVDAVLAIALLVAGIVHSTSTLVKDCSSYNTMFETYHGSALFRCGDITVSVVLTFVTCVLFLVTLVWSFARDTCKSVKGDNLETALAQEEANAAINGYEQATTPGKKASSDAVSEQVDLQHPVLKLTRRCVRLLQFACSLVAFILFVASYKPYYSGQYVSPAATYVILMSYSGWLYALWHSVAVETLKLSRRPRVGVERLMDVLVAVLLLVAGIIFAVSSQVTDCEDTSAMLETYHLGTTLYRCGNMDSGYIFAFVAVALYVITFALSFLYRSASSNSTDETTEVGQQV
ncbi:hypothetical protein PF005_g17775 [Phytophthora fragariae]|uniref:MARVEL domain-containing protein n=2 Tax=Phytophthora TaxID=4783 RepID=A0A6A3TA18_9STRA|nr:hypothetical protein PF003_g8746 [Phytophthora fragariae]KAE8931039.1 hypothetical protein PF009_g18889 [Phytophthora fragariae]KAE8994725.1 hypothetical protein PF011_g16619 [Phytophthora fragariae]KAE9094163.1 hypothetical protein PF010_g17212 [Phytophthora fragariae]KAE9094298.1 hypothetical protein PF007_g17808 [Phytophthora fragariae]